MAGFRVHWTKYLQRCVFLASVRFTQGMTRDQMGATLMHAASTPTPETGILGWILQCWFHRADILGIEAFSLDAIVCFLPERGPNGPQ